MSAARILLAFLLFSPAFLRAETPVPDTPAPTPVPSETDSEGRIILKLDPRLEAYLIEQAQKKKEAEEAEKKAKDLE